MSDFHLEAMVNVHSHAFQRGLRGVADRPASLEPGRADFWGWRQIMFELAERLDPDSIYESSLATYREMVLAGYGAVGEFHYVHHQPDGRPYADPNAMAIAVAEAAREAGLRIVLLPAAYHRNGWDGRDRPAEGAQRRFSDPDVETFLARVDELCAWASGRPGVEVGVAAHSVRAVPTSWLSAIAEYADARGIVRHVHAHEQVRELEECRAEHDMAPIGLLQATGFLGAATTIVHGTHVEDGDVRALAAGGCIVAACPTTEANLGDGWIPAQTYSEDGVSLAIGSDSNVRIDPFEEVRELETICRRAGQTRSALIAHTGDLWAELCRNGRRSLGIEGGPTLVIDTSHRQLAGIPEEHLPYAIATCASASVVAGRLPDQADRRRTEAALPPIAGAEDPVLTVAGVLRTAAQTAIVHRDRWDQLDARTGDGDIGTTLSRGFGAVLEAWPEIDAGTSQSLLTDAALVLANTMGGTSGPLWSVALLRAGAAAGDGEPASADEAASMLRAAVEGIQEYGGAELGDKTLLDALVPAADALAQGGAAGLERLRAAALAAAAGARETRSLVARRGRGSYLGQRTIGLPDPGAVVVAQMFAEVARLAGADTDGLEEIGRLEGTAGGPADSGGQAQSDAGQEPAVKGFVNDPQDLPLHALAGFALAHSELVSWDPDDRIVRRATAQAPGRVGLVSGGGSGHEPLHVGFVGAGMLSAAAPGSIFASPTVGQIVAATRAADSGGGVLQIVKNYTGDVINFRLAAEILRQEGLDVVSVVIKDDIATADAEIGARGTAATLFVEKLSGALAEDGASLSTVTDLAARVASRSVSIGVALAPCAPPGGLPLFELDTGEIEIGIGIHGERGIERTRWKPAKELVAQLLETLRERVERTASDPHLLLVNGLGATTELELYLLYGEVRSQLASLGIEISRSLVGSYVTSLNMAGASISLLALDDELTKLWDAPVVTPALRWGA